MTENEIKKLMEKYLNGTITKKEEILLEKYDSRLLEKNEPATFRTVDHKKQLKLKLFKTINGHRKTNAPKRWTAIAASLIIIISLGFLMYNFSNTQKVESLKNDIVKTTDWGQKMNVTLSDGTKVKLNSGSTIQFPQNFNGGTRQVELVGEAFFDVTENKDKPFMIQSGDIKTTVLGTSFNINAYSDDDEIAVTLASGKVKVVSNDKTIFLHPNEQAVFNKKAQTLNSQKVKLNRYIDWKNGIIHITDATLQEAAEVIERWYGVTLIFENQNLANCHITATYDNQTLATVLESMKYTKKGLDYEYLEVKKILMKGNCTD